MRYDRCVRGVWLLVLVGCGRIGFGSGSASDVDGAPGDGAGDAASDGTPDTMPTSFVVAVTTLPNAGAPSARRSTGAAVAPDNRIWMYGGFAGAAGVQSDTGVYTPGVGWAFPTVTGAPAARERHALAWDGTNNRLVVFGGYSGTFPQFVHNDELHVFSPAANAWTQIPKAGTWPAARKDAAMVWSPSLGKLLLYGGNNGSGAVNRFSELWTLSIDAGATTATWTLLSPGGAAAPAQSAPCFAIDPAARRVLLYGGELTDGTDASSTYQYLIDTNAWQLDTTTGSSPGGRSFTACAWDPTAARLALYGGQTSGSPTAGTYSYDPAAKTWANIALDGSSNSPGNISDAGAVYSATLGGMFVFGGRTATTSYSNQSLLFDLKPQ